MRTIINGQTIDVSGNSNVVIQNGHVFVNGKEIETKQKYITIKVNGDCQSIKADSCERVEVKGNVGGNISTVSGDVDCGDIDGSVNTVSGDVNARTIGGSVNTVSGDIRGAKR